MAAVNVVQLLQFVVQNKGSDLHLHSNCVPMVRILGDLVKANMPAMTPQEVEAVAGQITSPAQKAELAKERSIDFSFRVTGLGVVRTNIYHQRQGLTIVMRVLSEKIPTLDELRLPEMCKKACALPNGLVLVTGPTGSGKTSTLAAMINHINMTEPCHILTLEDPIEYQYQNQACTVNQRGLGLHFTTFASAMRAALREDPDVILIGEMRDAESVALAIKAAETGHLVLSTLHTSSAAKAVDRIINCFPAAEQPQIRTVLSETLKMVIAQKLIPTADRKRRIPVHDVLVNNAAVGNLIREGKTFQIPSIMQTGSKEGMQVFDTPLLDLATRGEIDGKMAYELATEKKAFMKWAPAGAGPVAPVTPLKPPGPPGQPAQPPQAPQPVKKVA